MVVYDQNELFKILQDKRYHFPELSETDNENPSEKCCISVYDYS